MRRTSVLLIAGGLLGAIGCKSTQHTPEVPGEMKPALLIGPEASAKAPAPVELPPKESAKLCLEAAREFEKYEKTEDAIRLYEKARSMDPAASKVALRRLAVLHSKAGDFSKANTEYETLLKANPKDADLLNDCGYNHYCRGDWAAAEAHLLRAVQIDPNHKRAWINLGMAQSQLGKWEESFQSFCKAVRPAEAHSNVAFALATRGRKEEAKAQYQQALALDPSLRIAQVGLAQLESPTPVVVEGLGERPRQPGTARGKRYDAAEQAAKVPTLDELELRMKKAALDSPVIQGGNPVKVSKAE